MFFESLEYPGIVGELSPENNFTRTVLTVRVKRDVISQADVLRFCNRESVFCLFYHGISYSYRKNRQNYSLVIQLMQNVSIFVGSVAAPRCRLQVNKVILFE